LKKLEKKFSKMVAGFEHVFALVLLGAVALAQKERTAPRNSKLGNVCVDGGYLRFDPKPPTRQKLTMCSTYSERTCCNETHTNKIKRQALGYYEDEELAVDCRTIAVDLHCSMCDPRIGTGLFPGVCHDYCSDAYHKCRDAYYELYDARLRACLSTSLLCSPLHTIVAEHLALHYPDDPSPPSNGETFCELAGLRTAKDPPCYDGSLPPIPPSPPPTRRPKGGSGWFPSLIDIEIALARAMRDWSRLPYWKRVGLFVLSLFAAWSLATMMHHCMEATARVVTGGGGDPQAEGERRYAAREIRASDAEREAELKRAADLDKQLADMDNFMLPEMDNEVD